MSLPPDIAALLQQMGPESQPAPPPQAPNVNQQLMTQAQGALNNPMGQAVPPAGGQINPMQHPIVAGIVKALANAAQGFGWTAMQPSERLERTQLNQNKAQALAQMAQTGEYRQGELGLGQQKVDVSAQRADIAGANEESIAAYRTFQQKNQADRTQLLQDQNQWKQDIAQGRLAVAQQTLDQKASQFEQKFGLATKQFGLDQAKLELMGEGMTIKQGMLDLAKTALSQKGTTEGVQTLTKLQQLKMEHPILTSILGLDDISSMVEQAGTTAMPGTAPVAPAATPTPTGVPTPENKAAAKRGGGVRTITIK